MEILRLKRCKNTYQKRANAFCVGSLSGIGNTSGTITCAGNISGDINCKGNVTVQGNVESTRIKRNVVCNSLKCDKIEGDVVIK